MQPSLYERPPVCFFLFGSGSWDCVQDVFRASVPHKDQVLTVSDGDSTWPATARDVTRLGYDVCAIRFGNAGHSVRSIVPYVDSVYLVEHENCGGAIGACFHRGPVVGGEPTFIFSTDRNKPAERVPMALVLSLLF